MLPRRSPPCCWKRKGRRREPHLVPTLEARIVIVVVDCGMGNLQSVVRALQRVGGDVVASSDVEAIEAADKIVLPGVGSLAQGMDNLARRHLLPLLAHKVLTMHTPVLGICLGHQMLVRWGEEGAVPALGWIDGVSQNLRGGAAEPGLKVPHLGWNTLTVLRECPLLRGVPLDACFYFAHSYGVLCNDRSAIAATTRYGSDFVSVLHREHIFGTQFHPEKSQANGLTVLRNFVEFVPGA
jgi:glutamine amidotransferase